MAKVRSINTKGMQRAKDTLGGFGRLPTDIYVGKIKQAYFVDSEVSESQSVVLTVGLTENFAGDEVDREYTERCLITNKDGDAFFEKNGHKVPLQGFTIIDDICQILTEASLTEQETETKKIKIRDRTSGEDIPTPVEVLIDIIGEEIALAIQHKRENKREKDSKGNYQPKPEPVELNSIVKVFSADDFSTLLELEEEKDPTFAEKWMERYHGKMYDTYKESVGGAKVGRPSRNKPGRNDDDQDDDDNSKSSRSSGRRGLSLGRKN